MFTDFDIFECYCNTLHGDLIKEKEREKVTVANLVISHKTCFLCLLWVCWLPFAWNRPETRMWGTQAYTIMLKEPYPLRGYLGLHAWRKWQEWPGVMLMTLFLCTADQRNCCDNFVSSGYPLHQPSIITIFCIFIGASQSTVSCWELNTIVAVMFLVEEGAWIIPCHTTLIYFATIYS